MLTLQITKEAHPAACARKRPKIYRYVVSILWPDNRRNVFAYTQSASRFATSVYSKACVELSCRFYNNRVASCFDKKRLASIIDHEGSRVIHKFNKARAERAVIYKAICRNAHPAIEILIELSWSILHVSRNW